MDGAGSGHGRCRRRRSNRAALKGATMPIPRLLAAAIGSQLENVSTLDPASPSAESIRYLFFFLCAVAAFILAIVWGVLFYSVIRFRRKRAAGERSGTEPPQVYGSLPIEIAWTVAPTLIVL